MLVELFEAGPGAVVSGRSRRRDPGDRSATTRFPAAKRPQCACTQVNSRTVAAPSYALHELGQSAGAARLSSAASAWRQVRVGNGGAFRLTSSLPTSRMQLSEFGPVSGTLPACCKLALLGGERNPGVREASLQLPAYARKLSLPGMCSQIAPESHMRMHAYVKQDATEQIHAAQC